MPTISVISTKWSETARPLLVQAWRALLTTVIKLRKSLYSSTRASSRADQNSPPRSLTRWMRWNVVAAGVIASLLIVPLSWQDARNVTGDGSLFCARGGNPGPIQERSGDGLVSVRNPSKKNARRRGRLRSYSHSFFNRPWWEPAKARRCEIVSSSEGRAGERLSLV